MNGRGLRVGASVEGGIGARRRIRARRGRRGWGHRGGSRFGRFQAVVVVVVLLVVAALLVLCLWFGLCLCLCLRGW